MRRSALLGWQSAFGLIALVSLPTVWRKKPLWTLGTQSLAILGLAAAAYLVAVFVLRTAERRGQPVTLRQVLLVGSAAFMPILLAVLAFHPEFSRFAALTIPLLGVALLAFLFWIQKAPGLRLLAVAALALAASALQIGLATGRWTEERLEKFLANPAAVIPGTTMVFPGIPDAGTRRKLIEYLASPQSDLTQAPSGGEL